MNDKNWHRWFAWYPVVIPDDDMMPNGTLAVGSASVAWMIYIERIWNDKGKKWEYRFIY